MLEALLTIGIINFLGVLSPGPDFAIVTKNTLRYSRKNGMFTSFGIATASAVHTIYCMMGLAQIIMHSKFIFLCISIVGGSYLLYLGLKELLSKSSAIVLHNTKDHPQILDPVYKSFFQGFVNNILNIKAISFFLSIFTMFNLHLNTVCMFLIPIQVFIITSSLFCLITYFISYHKFQKYLQKYTPLIGFILGAILTTLGITIILRSILNIL